MLLRVAFVQNENIVLIGLFRDIWADRLAIDEKYLRHSDKKTTAYFLFRIDFLALVWLEQFH